MKRINAKLIKARCTYSISKLAEVIGVHPNTLHKMIKNEGLPRVEGAYPYLVYGKEVIAFLKVRQQKNKITLAPEEFYCCTCQAARTALDGQTNLNHMSDTRGMLKALCAVCEGKMSKFIALKNLPHLRTLLDIHTLQESTLVKSAHNNTNSETKEV